MSCVFHASRCLLPRSDTHHPSSGANPAYTAEELEYQLGATKARVLISHAGSLSVALAAAQKAGIPHDRVVLFDEIQGTTNVTVDTLVEEGLAQPQAFVERRLAPGEGKKKLAFLSFSSGTTGRPKVKLRLTCRNAGDGAKVLTQCRGRYDPSLRSPCECYPDGALYGSQGRQ